MKLPLSFWVFAIAGFIAPSAEAGQQSGDAGARGQVLPFAFSTYNSGAFGLNYFRVSRIIASQHSAKES